MRSEVECFKTHFLIFRSVPKIRKSLTQHVRCNDSIFIFFFSNLIINGRKIQFLFPYFVYWHTWTRTPVLRSIHYTQYHFQLSTVLKPCSSTKRYQEPYSNKIYNYPTVFYRINFKEDSIMKSSHHPLDNVHKFDSYTNC